MVVLVLAYDIWADSVVLFVHGDGQWYGQGNYPYVVLGNPDPSATPTNPSLDVLSLGTYGIIVLQFKDNVVVDGPGDDLVIFENVFLTSTSPDTQAFLEPALVFLSKDGRIFYQYPYDTSNPNPYYWQGLAGIKPTNYGNDPNTPSTWMGDRFDISNVGLDTVRFVMLADASFLCGNLLCSGFDLDALGCLNCAFGDFSDAGLGEVVYAVGQGGDTSNWYYKLSAYDGNLINAGYNGIVIYFGRFTNVPSWDARTNTHVVFYGGRDGFANAFYYESRDSTHAEIDSLLSRNVQPPFSVGDTLDVIVLRCLSNCELDGIMFNGNLDVSEKYASKQSFEIYSLDGRRLKRMEKPGIYILRKGSSFFKVFKRR